MKLYIILLTILTIGFSTLLNKDYHRAPASIDGHNCSGPSFRLIKKSKPTNDIKNQSIKILKENFFKVRANGMSKATQEEKNMIAEAYLKYRPDAPRINFENNLAKLLNGLPKEDIDIVEDILENHYQLTSRADYRLLWSRFGGGYDVLKKEIIIIIPERFIETDIEYLIKMHETYHLVNAIVRERKISEDSTRSMHKIMQSIEYQYLDEAGAIAQEWQYINLIPNKIRHQIVEEIKRSLDIPKTYRNFLVRVFSSESKTPAGHIISEHKAGRYSKNDFINEMKTNTQMDIALYSIIPIGGFFLSTIYCDSLNEKNKTDTLFYEYVCKRHPLIP